MVTYQRIFCNDFDKEIVIDETGVLLSKQEINEIFEYFGTDRIFIVYRENERKIVILGDKILGDK